MGFTVEINVTQNRIPSVIDAVSSGADDCVRQCADGIRDAAQSAAPVLTGALRSGIDVEGAGRSVVVKASSLDGGGEREYAAYNEYGTRYMSAQPFMRPGFQAAMGSSVPAAIAEYAAKIEAGA